jgi:hypothetical protein
VERRGTVGSRQTNAVRETAVGTAAAAGEGGKKKKKKNGTWVRQQFSGSREMTGRTTKKTKGMDAEAQIAVDDDECWAYHRGELQKRAHIFWTLSVYDTQHITVRVKAEAVVFLPSVPIY